MQKINNKVNSALKLLLLIFLFNKSMYLIPEYSILINCSPSRPKINGVKKLKLPGNEDVILVNSFCNCLNQLLIYFYSPLFLFNFNFFIIPIH